MARNCKVALALVLTFMVAGTTARGMEEVALDAHDRILILAPHPDDEVIGCGGVIQRAVAMGLPVRVVFLTYGDNNEWSFLLYRKHPVLLPRSVRLSGMERHDEALAAATVFGVATNQLTFLGYPDFGTLAIWYRHWGARPPYRSLLTRVRAVPYTTALRPGAPYKGEEILRDLTTVLREFRPTKIFLSHPADHNQDHRALYLFTRVALWDLRDTLRPQLYPYLIHFAGWPKRRGRQPKETLTAPKALHEQINWQTSLLTDEQVTEKLTALKRHRSQWLYSGRYLRSFVCANELFGDFPDVLLRDETPMSPAHADRGNIEMPEQLTESEKAAFVGMAWRYARLEGDALVLSVELSRPLARQVEAALFVFGYRPDLPFSQMPKIQIKAGELGVTYYNQLRRLPRAAMAVTQTDRRISVHVPLSLLGEPTRILTSARTSMADVPLDWAAWRVLELPPR